MSGQGDAASYTINLDTSAHTVEETAPGNYRIPTLSPTIDVPYAAWYLSSLSLVPTWS